MNIRRSLALLAALALFPAACGGGSGTEDADVAADAANAATDAATSAASGAADAAAEGELSGMLTVIAGECTDGGVTTGSWFRMIQPNGTVGDGPYVENGDSTCGDKTWTALAPGSDGGLRAGDYQPNPDPAFDEAGNALATTILQPTPFFAVAFGAATNEVDPQTSASVPAPTIIHDGNGGLTGDLSAWGVAYNGAHFNQGAPKADGSTPGNTSEVTGTFDPATGAYTLEWSSQIVGGPFNNFTGVWHLEGTFEG